MTQVLPINPIHPEADVVQIAADVLRQGGLVAYPTETVYGLAANLFLADGVARVFHVKQRPLRQALPVQIADIRDIAALARSVPPEAEGLIDAFFPGPLTLILDRLPAVSSVVTGGGPTLGLRMPAHAVPLAVMRALGTPVVCPSANITGRRAPMSAQDVLEDLDGLADLVLDGGPTQSRVASTVLDVSVRPARLVREGKITRAALEAFLPLAP